MLYTCTQYLSNTKRKHLFILFIAIVVYQLDFLLFQSSVWSFKMKDDPISKQYQIYTDTIFKRKFYLNIIIHLTSTPLYQINYYLYEKYAGNRYEAVTRYFKSSICTFKLSITYTEVDDSRQMYFFDRKDKGCPILGEYMTHLRKHST